MPVETPKIINVARFLCEMATSHPDHTAVRLPIGRSKEKILYKELSFSELNAASDTVCHLLKEKNIVKGTKTLLMVKPGLDLILCAFALFKTGAVPIVIDPGMGLKNFRKCVKKTKPEALVGISAAQFFSRVFQSDFSSVKHRFTVGNRSYKKSLKSPSLQNPFALAKTQAKDLAAILFTSGSTGAPKGVCYEHEMFEAQVRFIFDTFGISPGEVDMTMLPVFALFNPAMGMTTVVPEMDPSRPAMVKPKKIVQAIQQNKVTNTFGSPVLWEKISRYCLKHKIELPTLKRVLMAGAPASPALIQRCKQVLVNAEIYTPYGATESLPVSAISGTEILEETKSLSETGAGTCVGSIIPGMDAKIISITEGNIEKLEDAQELPQGEIGEIIVKGPVVTKKYHQLEDATAAAKIKDSSENIWHRIGDLGYFDKEKRLWFCGRKVERVCSKDKIFYTDCCEAILNQHEKVFRSALIGWGEKTKQEPAIVIEPEANFFPKNKAQKQVFIQELLGLAQSQEHTKEIKHFFFHKKFPVDVRHNAKIHRLTLAKIFAQ